MKEKNEKNENTNIESKPLNESKREELICLREEKEYLRTVQTVAKNWKP